MCLVLKQTKPEDLRLVVSQFNLILQKIGVRKPGMAASAYGPCTWEAMVASPVVQHLGGQVD